YGPHSNCKNFQHSYAKRLGFDNYYVQGGDWGSTVVEFMSLFFPQFVRGHHNNFLNVQPPFYIGRILVGSFFPSLVVTSERDQKRMFPFKDYVYTLLRETGYMHIQATKPDTIGHGLTDSPAGLAAYILEKFSVWTNLGFPDCVDGCLLEKFELDDLLNNVMVYWISGSITSSMRLYKETFGNFYDITKYDPVPNSVPLGYADFPQELTFTPENWLSYKYKNVISFTAMPDGGHFAAFEQPKLLAEDLRQFTTKVEEFLEKKIKI
ncbi:Epoxide hydrolase 1, partial [Apostichopus japonicus]